MPTNPPPSPSPTTDHSDALCRNGQRPSAGARSDGACAFTTPSQRHAVALAAGVEPFTCPPYTLQWFNPALLRNRTLLYFSLHGIPHQPYWYGDSNITAISTAAFDGLDLSQTVVFVANCHLPQTPFLQAILACNPRFLVGGTGLNYTRTQSLVGAHLLGHHFRRALDRDLPPARALALAKHHVNQQTTIASIKLIAEPRAKNRSRIKQDIAANRDALAFKAYT